MQDLLLQGGLSFHENIVGMHDFSNCNKNNGLTDTMADLDNAYGKCYKSQESKATILSNTTSQKVYRSNVSALTDKLSQIRRESSQREIFQHQQKRPEEKKTSISEVIDQ